MQTITFYSYKGGTGRSLLLANMAMLAAGIGKRVVALDFDLEAPGQIYKLLHGGRPHAEGIVGWVRDALAGDSPAALEDYVVDVPLPQPFVPGGWLKLMPAGRAPSPNYFQDLRRLGLDQALEEGRGINALLQLQEQLASELDADLLLIDARTGITSTNAVTTQVLADDVVVLTLDTPEQLEGTRGVLRALQPLTSLRTKQPLGLHVVLSRIPPRPPDAGTSGLTPGEREQRERVRAFLNEPAQPLSRTLEVDGLHLLHTNLDLQRNERLFLERPGSWTRSTLHVDYLLVGRALFGDTVEDAATHALREARPDPERLEALAHFFAEPDALLEARGLRAGGERESSQRADVDLVEQIDVLRELAGRNQSVLPDLAKLLTEVSNRFGELGQREEALDAIEEATGLYRRLAETNPQIFQPDLAMALNNFSNRLSELGRHDEALDTIEEATGLYRRLAETNPQIFQPDLAMALNNFSNQLSRLGRHDEALNTIEKATEIYQQLADTDPKRFQPNLATSLNNLSNQLSRLGRLDEALNTIEKATEIYRQLADTHPQLFKPDLAMSLNNLSNRLAELGRHEAALDTIQAATEIYQELADTHPQVFQPDLAVSLNNLSNQLSQLGRYDEALDTSREATNLRRELAAARPQVFQADLAMSLNNLSHRLSQLGHHDESLNTIEEATKLRRELAATHPVAFRPDLAASLNNLSNQLSELGNHNEALDTIKEATDIYQGLADMRPQVFQPDFAMALNNLSNRLSNLGRHDEALDKIEEATKLYRSLADTRPQVFQADLAMALNNLSTQLSNLGRHDEAERAAQEAEEIGRELLRSPEED